MRTKARAATADAARGDRRPRAAVGGGALALQRTAGNRAVARLVTRAASPEAVQRRVGFEFEIVSTDQWNVWRPDGRSRKPVTDTKATLLAETSDAGLSADNGNVEFRTAPLASYAAVTASVGALVSMCERLGREPEHRIGGDLYVTTNSKDPTAKPQATYGIALSSVPALFESITKLDSGKGDAPALEGADREDVGRVVGGASGWLIPSTQAAEKVAEGLKVVPAHRPPVVGLFAVMVKALADAIAKQDEVTDPKYYFSMMHRTDFRTMFASLDPAARATVQQEWSKVVPDVLKSVGVDIDTRVFPRGYKGEDNKKWPGPTIREWFASVFAGGGGKDLLSPPPGHRAHDTAGTTPEGLGAMSADGALMLFELRDLGRPLKRAGWVSLAQAVAAVVGHATGDEALKPPQQAASASASASAQATPSGYGPTRRKRTAAEKPTLY